MTILQAIILGIVQGLTELLPISSSAHLNLIPWIFNWNIPDSFDVALHFGTLLAIGIFFFKDWVNLIKGGFNQVVKKEKTQEGRMFWYIVLATLPGGMMIQKGAFLCAESNVETSVAFTKKFSAGLFGGEGFVLQKATGNGKIFLEVDGDIIQKDLAPGEIIKANTGNVVAFEPSVSYGIETISGLGNIFLGGEGLFLTKLVGPGKVILQSQNFKDFAGRLIPYMPRTTNNN